MKRRILSILMSVHLLICMHHFRLLRLPMKANKCVQMPIPRKMKGEIKTSRWYPVGFILILQNDLLSFGAKLLLIGHNDYHVLFGLGKLF